MPVEKVKDPETGKEKFRWGRTGKLYTRRIDAVKQGEAVKAKKSSTGMSKGGTVNSARKAQMVAKQYKAKGGGYKS
jgi:hypothetical protein